MIMGKTIIYVHRNIAKAPEVRTLGLLLCLKVEYKEIVCNCFGSGF